MSTPAEWTIITVTYNNADELRRCWAATSRAGFRWIVADNASSDGSADIARALGADVLELGSNLGFAAANNHALERVSTEWVSFANPDVILDPGSLDRLSDTATRYGALVAPQLVELDGSIQPNGRGLPFPTDKLAHRGIRLPGSDLDQYVVQPATQRTYVAWVMGAAICGPTETFQRLGGWDERYFIYYEDHDLGLTAWRAGIPVIVDPEAVWVHEWKRATAHWSWIHWRHELASGWAFYRKYPELLIGSRRRAMRRHASLDGLVGTPVDRDVDG